MTSPASWWGVGAAGAPGAGDLGGRVTFPGFTGEVGAGGGAGGRVQWGRRVHECQRACGRSAPLQVDGRHSDEAALILHRKGFDCRFPSRATGLLCSTTQGKVS